MLCRPRLYLLTPLLLLASACGDDTLPGEDAGLPDAGPAADHRLPDGSLAPDTTSPPDAAPPAPDQATGPCNKKPTATLKYTPGKVYYGRNNYIQYVAGDLPIVISSPHGGYLKPSEIADRTYGVKGLDTGSQEKTWEVAHYLKKLTGRYPHVVINRLARIKLDANREIKEASQGSKWSEQAWAEYHQYIEGARRWVTQRCGKGQYLDFHTNGHSAKWVEFGYLLTSTDLNRSDTQLNAKTYIDKSSIRALALSPGANFPELVRGPSSLGGLLAARGYKTVPSPQHTHPAGQGFFSGGYNTRRHGSRTAGTIDGIQVETYSGFINKEVIRDDYSRKLAESIRAYVELHYALSLKDHSWAPPQHSKCVAAKALKLTGGAVTVQDSTLGADNEFGQQITCGNSFTLDGPQVYYAVTLKAGASYQLRLKANYPARFYLFGDSCTATMVSDQCKQSGVSGPLVQTNSAKTVTYKATRSGRHAIAVDSRSRTWYGAFELSIKQL